MARRKPRSDAAASQASGSACAPAPARKVKVTDHAVLRFIERTGLLDVAALRRDIADRLARAAAAAEPIGGAYRIRIEHLDFVCVENRVVTVVDAKGGR